MSPVVVSRAKPTEKAARKVSPKPRSYELPTERRAPVDNPWAYAYFLVGEKKVGKTSWAIHGCEEFVLQFDKPQLAYTIREQMIDSWAQSVQVIDALVAKAKAGELPYERIVVDGVGEWYAMCQTATCQHFAVEHPSDEGYARAWHHLRDAFSKAVTKLLSLQALARVGVVFIAHSEWKETKTRGGAKVDKLVPNLASRAEEIINGKVDGWFTYCYSGRRRILVVLGDEETGAGHRIDGHFMTRDGRRIREIDMGDSAEDAMRAFLSAFSNQQEYADVKELSEKTKTASAPAKVTKVAKKVVRRA